MSAVEHPEKARAYLDWLIESAEERKPINV